MQQATIRFRPHPMQGLGLIPRYLRARLRGGFFRGDAKLSHDVGVAGKRDATRPAESLGWSRMGSDALVFRAKLASHAFLLTSITQTCIARLQHLILGSAYRSTYLLRVLQPTACHGRLPSRHRGRSSDAPCSFCASGAHTLPRAASAAGDKLWTKQLVLAHVVLHKSSSEHSWRHSPQHCVCWRCVQSRCRV